MFCCIGTDSTGAVGKMSQNLQHVRGKHVIMPRYYFAQSSNIIRNQKCMIFKTVSYSKLVTRCHAVAGTTARCALYNECTNPNPATNLIPVHNLQ